MTQTNLVRMIQLAGEFFDSQNDPDQIGVDEHVLERLKKIHPSCIAEKRTRQGPVAWTLVLPTSRRLMELFITNAITERELLRRTRAGRKYEAIYLCSALVLPEFRRKGIARHLVIRSITAIRKQHPIEFLYCWPFSSDGEQLAEVIAQSLRLPLFKKK
jgi:GNAT superfamily N-acetyltransferase